MSSDFLDTRGQLSYTVCVLALISVDLVLMPCNRKDVRSFSSSLLNEKGLVSLSLKRR